MQSRLALHYLDELLLERTGKSYVQFVRELRGPEDNPRMSWYQIALELAEVTRRRGASPETVRRWYEKPL